MAIKLIREESEDHNHITGRVEFTIPDGITWYELIEYMVDFMKGCGYQLPKGELIFVENDEIVVKKAEQILYGKE